MMKLIYLLPFLSAIVLQPTIANALSPEQIQKIAQSVTLKIETTGNGTKSSGSGVTIQKQGNNYLLVTNAHVVCINRNYLKKCDKRPNYQIVTPDLQSHTVTAAAVKVLPNLDLALIQFQSDRNYPVATLGNSDNIAIDEPIYTAGFPATKSRFSFHHGTIVASVKKRLTGDGGGYTVIYDAATNSGMSGGGVFDRQGQIIAIHGQGERYQEGTTSPIIPKHIEKDLNTNYLKIQNASIGQKIGINRGIPINYLLSEASTLGILSTTRKSSNNAIFKPTTADDWFIIGLTKAFHPNLDRLVKDKQEATQALSQAIKLEPYYFMAYYIRGRLWEQQNIPNLASNDYLVTSKLRPTSIFKYIVRSHSKYSIRDLNGALTDVNEAIKTDPNYPLAYMMRANIYRHSNNPSLAIADYDRVVQLDPNNANAFVARGMTKLSTSDSQGATADINQAIEINPESADPYRWLLSFTIKARTEQKLNPETLYQPNSGGFYLATAAKKQSQGDFKGALENYNRAIKIQPTAITYALRADLKYKILKDYRDAETDLTRAIELQPDEPRFYLVRFSWRGFKNKKGAISDLRKAADIFKKQGHTGAYAEIMNFIPKFEARSE
jgi:tetratricopeptide (TPR) repeat protein